MSQERARQVWHTGLFPTPENNFPFWNGIPRHTHPIAFIFKLLNIGIV